MLPNLGLPDIKFYGPIGIHPFGVLAATAIVVGFFLAMADKQGVFRHNLGFYEMLLALVLTVLIYALKDRHVFTGFYIALVVTIYTPVRFFLDSLRVSDKTYRGLTPGQYFSVMPL